VTGVQEVWWEGAGIEPTGEYTFFYGKGNENHELIQFLVKRVEFVNRVSFNTERWLVPYSCSERSCAIREQLMSRAAHRKNWNVCLTNFPNIMKILLGDFNAKICREDIFKPTIWNESLHEISNDNRVRWVNFAKSKNLKSPKLPHRNVLKFNWTSPDGKIHNQIGHVLVERRRHSNILDVRSHRAAEHR
jgi:hypothetical protein